MKNLKFIITFLLLLVLGVGESWGQGTLGCTVKIYLKGTPNVDVPEAGQVFITEDQVDINSINWQSTGMKITPTRPCTVYYYVKPAPGYHFCNLWTNGSGSTPYAKTNPGSYTKTAGSSSSNMVFWAVLEKDDDVAVEPTGTDGVAFNGAADTNYTAGSSSADWKVTLTFAENLTYDSSTPRSGANADAKTWISVTNKTTGTDASYTGVYTVSSGKAQMEFPYSMPAGTYNVHLPYGLFTTVSGKPTVACDFEIEVFGDDAPFELKSTNPNNGATWSAKYTDDNGNVTISAFSLDLSFSKVINRVDVGNKDLSLHHQETGKTIVCKNTSINYTNKSIVNLSYGVIPNGHYTVDIPAGIVLDANGNTNENISLSFTVTDSEDTWTLPNFEKLSTVSGVEPYCTNAIKITANFSSSTYGAALSVMPNADNITASVLRTQKGQTDIDEMGYIDIPNVTCSFSDGTIEIIIPTMSFTAKSPFSSGGNINVTIDEEESIYVNIPQGYVINKSAEESTSSMETLYKSGACVNRATNFSFTAKKVQKGDINADKEINVADVTELVNTILGTSRKTNVSDVNNDNNVDVSDVTELVNIILSK